MNDFASPASDSRRAVAGAAGQLERELESLTEVVRAIDDDPRLMDASLEEVHEIADRLARAVRRQVLPEMKLSADAAGQDKYGDFRQARMNESDEYEVYAEDLERLQRRQRKDLTVADSDSDKFALVKRRRSYIASLFDLYLQILHIANP